MNDFSISIIGFHFSIKHPYTITFDANSTASLSRTFTFSYTGADILNETSTIPEDIKKQLLTKLDSDFGQGPFKRASIKKALGDGKLYLFNFQ